MWAVTEESLPTALWVEAVLQRLNIAGKPYYIHQKGNDHSGVVLLKINGMEGDCKILIQQRNLDGVLQWMNALSSDVVAEKEADAYITRATQRDPDLWAIEVEDRALKNPFEN